MKYLNVIFLIIILLFVGCAKSTELVQTDNSLTNIAEAANSIDQTTGKDPTITPHTNLIRTEVNNVGENLTNLKDRLSKTEKELAAEKESYNKSTNKIIALITISSFLLTSISVALLLTGKIKTSFITVILGAVFLGSMALKPMLKPENQLIIGGIAAVFIIGAVIWAGLRDRFTSKALNETVKTIDEAKKAGLIDKPHFSEIANNIQQAKTKKIVSKLRNK